MKKTIIIILLIFIIITKQINQFKEEEEIKKIQKEISKKEHFELPKSCVINENRYRLPLTINPTKIKMELNPLITKFTFTGEENIEFKVTQETSCVILNIEDLNVTNVFLSRRGQKEEPE
jgi:3-deoxy-D-manno-octulosonic-acid transferase